MLWFAIPGIVILVLFFSLRKTEVDYYVLKPVDFDYTILASCSVGYPKPLDMTFQQEGTVKEVLVKEGDAVKKGQPLIKLDDFKQKQQVAIDESSLKAIELRLKNAKEEMLPNLREKLREAEINLQQAKSTLERSEPVFHKSLRDRNLQPAAGSGQLYSAGSAGRAGFRSGFAFSGQKGGAPHAH